MHHKPHSVARGGARSVLFGVALAAAFGAACRREEPHGGAPAASTGSVAVRSPAESDRSVGVKTVHAPPGDDAAAVVRDARRRADAEGRDLVVSVGASWCEPCERFHKAAASGALDADFPKLTVLAFDLDADRDRLARAGYESSLVPLFVVPGTDGRATSRRFEGSVKGDGAVANIVPRLRALLAK